MPKRPATARARGLGAELRTLRKKAGLSTRTVAQQLRWSASTLNRIENGGRNTTSEDVSALLALYKVTGTERDRLLDLARTADHPGWWEVTNSKLPTQLTALIGFESEATHITYVDLSLMPGLLQIPEYARALLAGLGVATSEIETLVVTRLGRQAILSKPNPPHYLTIIDEAVLRRPIGGPQVMATQLRHIVTVSKRPNVTVQVIPFEHGAHVGLDGSYVMLNFARAQSLVHLEHKRSGIFVDEPGDVEVFTQTTEILRKTALDSAQSIEFIVSIAREYEEKT
jgi:transcriptional regulator with XRE-family HTH domain